MWKVHNTTDIPDLSVYAAGIFVMEDKRLGDWVKSITLRNKKEGIVHGNYGMYRGYERCITLNVPTPFPQVLSFRMQYTGIRMIMRSKIEFMIAVLSHEFHHAYQDMTNDFYYRNYHVKRYARVRSEQDCEIYEDNTLGRFQQGADTQIKAAQNG